MRLLSFLELVESALRTDGLEFPRTQVSRQVNYEMTIARLDLPDATSLVVQNFALPDGQFCLKTWWQVRGEGEFGARAFFDANGADWVSAARQLAASKPEAPEPVEAGETASLVAGYRSAV